MYIILRMSVKTCFSVTVRCTFRLAYYLWFNYVVVMPVSLLVLRVNLHECGHPLGNCVSADECMG
jgi:hypothetical protein